MQSIDLDSSVSETSSSFSSNDRSDFGLESVQTSSTLKKVIPLSKLPNRTVEMDSKEQSNKKLSIVLTKEMHRLAKMQALKEDVTLKDLVVRLIQDHLGKA